MINVLSKSWMCRWQKVALALSLAGYVALVAFVIPRHESWADEAQAWQMARSVSFIDLFRTAIHYEFSPGLWHALLWPLAHLHMSYAGLNWFSASIALCGVCLLLFTSPLPLFLRLLLPYTYFFAFQYSVVARSYVLFAPLLFSLACIWPRRHQQPVLVALYIGLLANVSAHGLVTAGGLIAVIMLEQKGHMRKDGEVKRSWIIATGIAIAMIAFAAWCLIPPRNAVWISGASSAAKHSAAAVAILFLHRRVPSHHVPIILQLPIALFQRFCVVIGYGVSQPMKLGLAAWFLLLWRWWSEKRLRYAIPALLLAGFCIFSRFDTYHAGLLWILLLFLWWITWPADQSDPRQWALIGVFFLCVVSQLIWTVRVVRYDIMNSYSPDREAASTLQTYLTAGKLVDVAIPPETFRDHGEFFAVGLEPYFASEPFHDERARYWIWQPDGEMRDQYVRDTESRSVVVMLEEISDDRRVPLEQQRLVKLGYREASIACGRVYYPRQVYPKLCHVFYVPN